MTLPGWVGVGEPRGRLGGAIREKRYNLPHLRVHHTTQGGEEDPRVLESVSVWPESVRARWTGESREPEGRRERRVLRDQGSDEMSLDSHLA